MTSYGPKGDKVKLDEYAEEMKAQMPEDPEDAILLLVRGMREMDTVGNDSARYYGAQDLAGVLRFLMGLSDSEDFEFIVEGEKIRLEATES